MLPLLPFPSSAVLHLSRNLSVSRVSAYPHRASYGPSNVPLSKPMWGNYLHHDAASKNPFLTGRIFDSLISWSTTIFEKLMVSLLDTELHIFLEPRCSLPCSQNFAFLIPALMRLCLSPPSQLIS